MMAEALVDKENVAPIWVFELESRLQFRKGKLGHEIGAGAKCFTCKDKCPGLELHFWRKKCKNCRCGKEVHDVAEDDDLRFQILFKDKEKSSKYLAAKAVLDVKIKDTLHKNIVLQQFGEISEVSKPMMFDWVPSEASPLMAAEYMNELPSNKMPISGSDGAEYRKIQMQKQIPLHDLLLVEKEIFSPKEKIEYEKYMKKLREDAGIGRILRVKQIQFVEESEPCEVQSAQSSFGIRPIHSEIPDLNNGLRNINIRPPSYNSSPAGFRPQLPIRPLATYVEASPRSALRSLPRTIPWSILRLPSAFKVNKLNFENQPREYNDSMLSINNNLESSIDTTLTDSMFADNEDSVESVDITGITPLAQSPSDRAENEKAENNENGEISRPLSPPGTSTPIEGIDFSDPVETPSKYAQRMMTDWDSSPPSSVLAGEDQTIVASDVENANNRADETLTSPESQTEVHLVEKNMTCVDCQGTIEFNSIAVFIEKAGRKSAWHPKCFVCKDCKELLVDLMYFYHKGFVYCARHYSEKLKIHRCSACDELIFVPEYTFAEGHYYHLEHFSCAECDMELADKEYVLNHLNEGLPTCLQCYETIYAKRCNICGEAINAKQQGVFYKDLTWHATPECFKCTNNDCQKSLVNQKFIMINMQPFCSKECQFAMCMTKPKDKV